MIIIRLLRFILIALGVYFLYKLLRKALGRGRSKSREEQERSNGQQPPGIVEEMKKDPVCGTYVPEKQALRYRFHGTDYYFCSEGCKVKFKELKQSNDL